MPAVTRKESAPGQRKSKKRHRKMGEEWKKRGMNHGFKRLRVRTGRERGVTRGAGVEYAGLGFRV